MTAVSTQTAPAAIRGAGAETSPSASCGGVRGFGFSRRLAPGRRGDFRRGSGFARAVRTGLRARAG